MKIKIYHMVLLAAAIVSFDLSAYIVSYDQEPVSDNAIVPVFNSQGLSWDNDLVYLTYLFQDEIGQITFRTYLFTTINVSGFYRLATNVSNQITISASNVTLDLNGCTVSGGTNGIVINSGLSNVTIKNGTVSTVSGDGIQIGNGCTDITLENVLAKNALRGFNFSNVTNSIMRNCDMISNTTGVQITNGRNIVLQNCTAQVNTNAGYDLISSTTCALFDCKALSTGQGNTTAFNNLVVGFVSANGDGTIFERCIANSTQALTTTDSSSLIAGFALRGTEMCSNIINCEAADSMTSSNGFTVPYGILLEGTLSSMSTVTGQILGASSVVRTVEWSPDGQYLALIGTSITLNTGSQLQIFSFNRLTGQLQYIETGVVVTQTGVGSIRWSPDGQYLAVVGQITSAGGADLQIFSFNRTTGLLTLLVTGVTITSTNTVFAVAWSPDGQYLAVGGQTTMAGGIGSSTLQVLKFNRTTLQLTAINTGFTTTGTIRALAWSADGQYLVVGGSIALSGTDRLLIFRFNRSSGSLTTVSSGTVTSGGIFALNWSYDGQYIAIGMNATPLLRVFEFNQSTGALTTVTTGITISGTAVVAVRWSPDGRYFAIGGQSITGGTGDQLQVFSFDRSTGNLTNINMPSISGTFVDSTAWSPDGSYFAFGGQAISGGVGGAPLQVFTGIQFPSKNVLMNNTTYCNSGAQVPSGVGISGSSITNMIIQNSSFNNPISLSANFPLVYSDYQFVTNVFNQNFGDGPTLLQNISVDYNQPVLQGFDFQDKLAHIQNLAQSLVDNLL